MTEGPKIKERGWIAYGHEVQAILSGRQTQFQRVIKNKPNESITSCYHCPDGRWNWCFSSGVGAGDPWPCPYGVPGDRLWVREALYQEFTTVDADTPDGCLAIYSADGVVVQRDGRPAHYGWQRETLPPISMPRWASRILLTLKRVWVEKAKDTGNWEWCVEFATTLFQENHDGTDDRH